MLGGLAAGWDRVVGIEMTNEEGAAYIDIAKARLDAYLESHP